MMIICMYRVDIWKKKRRKKRRKEMAANTRFTISVKFIGQQVYITLT